LLLELLGLDEPVNVARLQPAGVPPALLRADHLLEGLLLRLAQADQFFLDLLLRFVQIGIESGLADDAQLDLMTSPRFLVGGDIIEIGGRNLECNPVAFFEATAVEVSDLRKGQSPRDFQMLGTKAQGRTGDRNVAGPSKTQP